MCDASFGGTLKSIWNKGRQVGPKRALEPQHIWGIRTRLQTENRMRDLALFDLADVPNVSSISPGNAAGVLGYCVKNKVLSGGGATSTLGNLMKKPGVTSSSGYSAGQAGNILTGQGQKFSLNKAPSQLKSQACNAVLKQAPKFL